MRDMKRACVENWLRSGRGEPMVGRMSTRRGRCTEGSGYGAAEVWRK